MLGTLLSFTISLLIGSLIGIERERSHPEGPQSVLTIIAAGILATVAMLIDVIIIIFVASPILFFYIIWPVVTMIVTGIIFALILLHYQKNTKHNASRLTNNIDANGWVA